MSSPSQTALAVSPNNSFPVGSELEAITKIGTILAGSLLVPDHFKGKREDTVFALLTARGLGIDPMVALNKGYVIKGRFDIEVSVKVGMVLSRLPDFDYKVIEHTDRVCILEGWLAGKEHQRGEFTIERAEKMGLLAKGGPWQTAPEDMLYWRAMGRLLKKVAPHAIYNMPLAIEDSPEQIVAPSPSPGREPSSAEVVEEARPAAAPPPSSGTVVSPMENIAAAPITLTHDSGTTLANEGVVLETVQMKIVNPAGAGVRYEGAAPSSPSASPPVVPLRPFLDLAKSLGFNVKHGPSLLRLVNELLAQNGRLPVKSSIALTREESTELYGWLKAKYPDGAPGPGKGAVATEPVSAGMTAAGAAPVPDAVVPEEPARPEATGDPWRDQIEAELARFDGTPAALIQLCEQARGAANGKRNFYSGRWFVDGPILKDCGGTDESGRAVAINLDKASTGMLAMLARGVLEVIQKAAGR